MNSNHDQGKRPRVMAMVLFVLAAVAMFTGVVPAQAQTIAFPAPTTFIADYCGSYPCGNSMVAVATGDFNGDGKLDVLTLDGSADLNVMLGNGDGTFQTPITLNISCQQSLYGSHRRGRLQWRPPARCCRMGDQRSDHGNAELHIFLGNGTGSLTYKATYAAPNSGNTNPGPNSIVAADVNGDGKLDLVAMTPYNGVFVFLGNGDGTFQAPIANATVCTNSIGTCQSLAVGDLNGDGKPDLAFQSNDTTGGGMSILLNTRHWHIWSGHILPRRDLWCFCRRRHRHR